MAIKNWFYTLVLLAVAFLMLLGGWWLYLVFKLANKLSELDAPGIQGNLLSMIKWEGASFIFLLFVIIIFLIYFYLIDHKKTKSLQEFFASFTHELKTPLASIKLQTQVICEVLNQLEIPSDKREQINTFAYRLIQDGHKLEDQLDNHLQLSRIERGAPLNLATIDLRAFITKETKRFADLPPVDIICAQEEFTVQADSFSLETIIRNLFENTLEHNPSCQKITIKLLSQEQQILSYKDYGSGFQGEVTKLTQLFYKNNSPNGTGIGLYLINHLMQRMHGSLQITSPEGTTLEFRLSFKKGI